MNISVRMRFKVIPSESRKISANMSVRVPFIQIDKFRKSAFLAQRNFVALNYFHFPFFIKKLSFWFVTALFGINFNI